MHPYARPLTALLELSLDFARQMIRDHGEFYPFGAALAPDLSPRMVGAYDGDEHPDRRTVHPLLEQAFEADVAAGKYAAVAITADVNIPGEYEPTYPDGIRVYIEAAGYCRYIYLPYRRTTPGLFARLRGLGPGAEFGELIPIDIPHRFFGSEPPSA
jgi:hypothetical protein